MSGMYLSPGKTDLNFYNFCKEYNIKDPFKEREQIIAARGIFFLTSVEGKQWEIKWKIRRDKYLRLMHVFRLWDKHFYLDWEQFKKELAYEDSEIEYCSCDCAGRQCELACKYFKGKCTRENDQLENPINRIVKEEYGIVIRN